MNAEVELRQVEAVRAAYIRFEGEVAKANKVFPQVFKAIGGEACGAPFFCYHEMDQEKGVGKVDLCVPTEEDSMNPSVAIQEFHSVKALCVIHRGSYETLGDAYKAIESYARQNQLSLRAPFREVFLKGPGLLWKGNPEGYITEVVFPLEEGYYAGD